MTPIVSAFRFHALFLRVRSPRPRPRARLGTLILVIVAGIVMSAHASVVVGTAPAGESDRQHFERAQVDARNAQDEKLRVGRARYEQKLALRQSVIRGMKTELARRQEVVPVVCAGTDAARSVAPAQDAPDPSALHWCLTALAIAGVAVFALRRAR